MKKKTVGMLVTLMVLVFTGASAWATGTGNIDRISGWFPAGTNLTVTATPDSGDTLSGWSGDTNSATFGAGTISFLVDGPKSIIATFADILHTITVSAGSGGSITPGTTNVAEGDNQGFTISPDVNYHIVDVLVDGGSEGTIGSYTFTNVTAPHTLSASFAIDTYTVTFDEGAHGSRTSGGLLVQTVDHGSAADAPVISADTGYTFTGWDQSFASITSDLTVTAQYATNTFTLIYLSDANGSVSGPTNQVVAFGEDGSAVTAVADAGYHFVQWSDASTANPRTDTSVSANVNVSASFAINEYTFTVDSLYGTPSPSGVTTHNWNTVISPAMADAIIINGTTQYVATGWTGTGSLDAGTGTNTSFTITNNTTMSWQWTTNYWIELNTAGE